MKKSGCLVQLIIIIAVVLATIPEEALSSSEQIRIGNILKSYFMSLRCSHNPELQASVVKHAPRNYNFGLGK